MRVTSRSTKNAIAGHNDRTKTDNAQHIDTERSRDNIYKVYDSDTGEMKNLSEGQTFEEYEKEVYQKYFQGYIDRQNEKNIQARHPERNYSTDALLTKKRYKPDEMILQIGDMKDHATKEQFIEATEKYIKEYNEKHTNSKIIDVAFHFDEQTPHAHARRIFFAKENGVYEPNMTKALKQEGYKAPEPEKKESKYNNPKQTFSAEERESWIKTIKEVCPELELETEPTKESKRQHLKTEEYKLQKIKEDKERELENLEQMRAESDELTDKIELQNIDYEEARQRTDQQIEEAEKAAKAAKLKKQKLAKLAEEEKKAQLEKLIAEQEKQRSIAERLIEHIKDMLRLIKNAPEKDRKELFSKEPDIVKDLRSHKDSLQSYIDNDIITDRGDMLDHLNDIGEKYEEMLKNGDAVIKKAEMKLKSIEMEGRGYSVFAEKQRQEIERLKNLQRTMSNPENRKAFEESLNNLSEKVIGHKFIHNTPELEADFKKVMKYGYYGLNYEKVRAERDTANRNYKKVKAEKAEVEKERDYAKFDLNQVTKVKDAYYEKNMDLTKELNALKVAKGLKKVVEKTQMDDGERTR